MTKENVTPAKENVTPATKYQIDALIEICISLGLNEPAILLKLASDELTKVANGGDEKQKSVFCACFEYIGDNPECPIHGADNDDSTAYDKERAGLYTIGMGA